MEKITRRKFLTIGAAFAGMTAVTGCGNTLAGGKYEAYTSAKKAKNWGMVIDMSKVKDIDALAQVCHSFHNVPKIDTKKDEVKWIWSEEFQHLFLDETHAAMSEAHKTQEFVTLCNHCRQPICVKVCPTKATFSNAAGVVLMDMHRCIGCRNCMAACPYGARSFNFKDPRPFIEEVNPEYPTRSKGVVEKCNFCNERLAMGLQPLCVEASEGAIVFGDLDDPNSSVSRLIAEKFTLQRRPNLGTEPKVYYII